MQEFFMPTYMIPTEEKPNVADIGIKIYLPNKCQHCNKSVDIEDIGSKDKAGRTRNPCDHFLWWGDLWKNRLTNLHDSLEKVAANKIINDIDDGCKCNKCGLWYAMAAPNQIDNTFKCYSCRNRGW